MGAHLRSTRKKREGSRRGSNFRPNVKKPTTWAKKGGGVRTPPPDPHDAHDMIRIRCIPLNMLHQRMWTEINNEYCFLVSG